MTDLTERETPQQATASEYLSIVAAVIRETDLITARYRLFDRECQAILNGVQDEDALLGAVGYQQTASP